MGVNSNTSTNIIVFVALHRYYCIQVLLHAEAFNGKKKKKKSDFGAVRGKNRPKLSLAYSGIALSKIYGLSRVKLDKVMKLYIQKSN